jgi:hypothetical protein
MVEDPHKGRRILAINEPENKRLNAKVELIEACLIGMNYEKVEHIRFFSVNSMYGWVLNNWEGTFMRITTEDIKKLYYELPQYTTFDEVENPGDLKIVKTASVSKKFGV